MGKNLTHGASRPMKVNPHEYGVHARALLIQIVILMMKSNIQLNFSNFKKPLPVPKSGAEEVEYTDEPSISGWFKQLDGDDPNSRLICAMLNDLVNLILLQMNDREATVAYPNEDNEAMIQQGYLIWQKEIDS